MTVHRAWWVRPLNAVLAPAVGGRHERATGTPPTLDGPPGPGDFAGGMRVLHDALTAAPLTPIGQCGARSEVRRRLVNEDALRRLPPEVFAQPVDRPIVVTGLPRTGTTLLHGLLARHPVARAPLLWELMHPLARGPIARRRARWSVTCMARFYHAAVPVLRDLHPLAPGVPEECLFALPHHLGHLARTPMPGYRRWWEARPADDDYRHLRGYLQALQWRRPAQRWVLKSPFHLHHLDALLRVFPDATIVHTRRDPVRALTSWCQLVEAIRLLQNEPSDPAMIGPEWLDIWALAVQRSSAVRAAHPDRFVDVDHHRLADDPSGTAAEIWRGLDDAAGEVAPAPAARRPRRHPRTPREYGLDPAEVRARLSPR
ncbi:sulfotransferase [Actinoplanes sp. NBRC 103695]|uniref:sulfotransferase family protein n=1 Tax=Actinoplanes sp. NBRC 103695 TaxID=3032202 RepID=UPI0025525C7B|nr:sulfotransferase [Actinoplanes sp. NBRC 103695]